MIETPETPNAAQPENASPMFSGVATGYALSLSFDELVTIQKSLVLYEQAERLVGCENSIAIRLQTRIMRCVHERLSNKNNDCPSAE